MTIDSRTIAEMTASGTVIGLSLARHMPAPKAGSIYYRWLFDTIQDLAKNNDRIGQVRSIPNG